MWNWSKDKILTFLKCYQQKPCLWNPKNLEYKNKNKVFNAWIQISKELNIPVAELKRKKEGLMTTFRFHLKRKRESMHSRARPEDIYQPVWFAYNVMEEFLLPVYITGKILNVENSTTPVSVENFEESDIDDQPSTSTVHKNGQDLLEKQMTKFDVLNSMLNKKYPEEDEYDLYGKLLAKKLKKLTDKEGILMMYKIDSLFVERINEPLSTPHSHFLNRPSSVQSFYSETEVKPVCLLDNLTVTDWQTQCAENNLDPLDQSASKHSNYITGSLHESEDSETSVMSIQQ